MNFESLFSHISAIQDTLQAYGEQLLKKLEKRLNTKGLNERRFREFRRLYLVYPH